MNKKRRIKVLIIDDSAIVREILTDMLSEDPDIIVTGTANDPFEAVKLIQRDVPDVLTLDLEMPRMDGISFLKKLMSQHPIPTIVISSHTASNKQLALKAYEYGAIYVVDKPEVENKEAFNEYSLRIKALVRAAGKQSIYKKDSEDKELDNILSPPRIIIDRFFSLVKQPPEIIAIGASAGGTTAVQQILTLIDKEAPPILITQHMPSGFTKEFADRLNSLCKLDVREAQGNEVLSSGSVFIAPGDKHLKLSKRGNQYFTQVTHDVLVNHHRPSVDVLFNSVAKNAGAKSLAIILSGMGRDGAQGMLEIRQSGGITLAQNKESSLVFGMPGEALRIDAAQLDVHIDYLGLLINQLNNL